MGVGSEQARSEIFAQGRRYGFWHLLGLLGFLSLSQQAARWLRTWFMVYVYGF